MERRMFGISLRDHIRNDALRRLSGVKDVVVATRENKLRWAGHIARVQDDRWSPYGLASASVNTSGWSTTVALE